MSKFVLKRDERKELFDIDKIKQVIKWATKELNINPLELESKFNEIVTDDISTTNIQDNLIYHARILCTPDYPQWSIVAGRLETMKLWKSTQIFEKSFHYYIQEQIKSKIYRHPAIKKWTKREIMELGEYIVQDRDLAHSYGSVLNANKKYLLKNECIQQLFMANAMIISNKETDRIDFAKKVYDALSLRKISLATPWLSNLRHDGNISSCFILQVEDDINSIFDNVKNTALISKNGGGIGIDLSKIRAKGSSINGNPSASKGIPSWSKIFNDVAVAVDQGGKRAGAFTIHCPIWHNDVEDFLTIQTENGDFRNKAFDIFPQIGVYDLFMNEVNKENGGSWHTFCPHEVKTKLGIELTGVFGKEFKTTYHNCIKAYDEGKLELVSNYNAKEFLKEIMKTQFETGLPYIGWLDEINDKNPNKHDGYIPCTNLCVESFSNVVADIFVHTCNLTSIVVGRVDSDEEMIELAKLCTRILDNGIDLTKTPIKEAIKHNNRYRTIGIGIQGLHDYIAKNGLTWKSYKDITKLAELIEYGAVCETIQLSKERGSYPSFKESEWDNGNMIARFTKNSVTDLKWHDLQELINKHGVRNSQLTSPAPTSSTSLFMDATAGIMPCYSAFYNEDNAVGKFSVYGMYIEEFPMAYEQTAPRQNQAELTKMVGALQKFVDTGISAEYIYDHNKEGFSAKDLYDTILESHKNKNKAVYYIRTIKKGGNIDDVIGGESVCVGCSG